MKKQLIVIGMMLMLLAVGFSGCTNPIGPGDTDGDGYNDDVDAFPNDSDEWEDSDGDGVGDNSDEFPNDSDEWEDSDGDGVGDNSDEFPNNSYEQYDSDKDGVGNNQDKFDYDSTQWADRDGDGYGDNPVGNNPDLFPDDRNEWKDSDSDGIGDNADIYDYGNAGIRVHVSKFQCDNPGDEFLTSPDPYLSLYLTGYFDVGNDGGHHYTSAVYWDDTYFTDPVWWEIDVDDDIDSVSLQIDAWEDDDWSSDEIIDLEGEFTTAQGVYVWFYPKEYTKKNYNSDGRNDFVDDEFDGWIEFTIEIVPI